MTDNVCGGMLNLAQMSLLNLNFPKARTAPSSADTKAKRIEWLLDDENDKSEKKSEFV